MPETDQLFHRLLSDPRQAQTTLRYYRLGGLNIGDVALGNTWGMLRWYTGDDDDWVLQLNVEGMGYSRFRLTGGVNEFQTIDFFANIPLEVRRRDFSARATLFHESSHLGDDYIRRTGSTGFRYSIEGVRLTLAYDLGKYARVYGGGMGIFHSIPSEQKGDLQWGAELRSPDFGWVPGHECWAYLGQDFRSRGKNEWNINSNTELGVRIGSPRVVRAVRAHVGYFTGNSEFGQFYLQHESYWNLGISFDF